MNKLRLARRALIPLVLALPLLGQAGAAHAASGGLFAGLSSVSCPQKGFCMAVGTTGSGDPQIERFSTQWVELPTPSTLTSDAAVSCVSTTFCVVVGQDIANPGVAVWNGRKWTAMTLPPLPSKFVYAAGFDGVTCLTTRFCVAVGSGDTQEPPSPLDPEPLVEYWNGSRWSLATVSPSLFAELLGVSCDSTGHCLAAGYGPSGTVYGYSTGGAAWTAADGPSPGFNSLLIGSACSAGQCWATGVYSQQDQSGTEKPLLERLAGGGLQSTAPPTSPANASILGASCVGTSFCMAAGYVEGPYNPNGMLVDRWNGSAWSTSLQQVPSGETISDNTYLASVSCASASYCVAVGKYTTDNQATIWPAAQLWNGAKWIATQPLSL